MPLSQPSMPKCNRSSHTVLLQELLLYHNQREYRFLQNKLNGDLSGMHFSRKLFDYERRSGPIWGESWTFSKPRIGRRLIYPTHSTRPTLILIYFPHRMQIPSSHIYPPHMTLHTCHEIHKWMIFGPDVSFATNSCPVEWRALVWGFRWRTKGERWTFLATFDNWGDLMSDIPKLIYRRQPLEDFHIGRA